MSERRTPLMPIECDLCGDPIWNDETGTPVTGHLVDHAEKEEHQVEGLLACPTCVETGPQVWIFHSRWNIQTMIEPAWAL